MRGSLIGTDGNDVRGCQTNRSGDIRRKTPRKLTNLELVYKLLYTSDPLTSSVCKSSNSKRIYLLSKVVSLLKDSCKQLKICFSQNIVLHIFLVGSGPTAVIDEIDLK